jgi:hypothetical protein
MTDFVENKIFADKYDLFDRALYGGMGHGVIVFPTYMFKVIFSIIFPPIGQILNIIEDFVLDEFPYITWDTIVELLQLKNLNTVIYSYLFTSLFYVPGLIFTLANLTIGPSLRGPVVECNMETKVCGPMPEDALKKKK